MSSPVVRPRSAYVTNLSEICHIVLSDRRLSPLFQWSAFDDLTAVAKFQKLYAPIERELPPLPQPLPPPLPLQQPPASLSDAIDLTSGDGENDGASSRQSPRARPQQFPALPVGYVKLFNAMNLYARLFHRKGPWFRADDLIKYYVGSSSDYYVDADPSQMSSSPFPPLSRLLLDLSSLQSLGLIHGFASEQECAAVCGAPRSSGGVLTDVELTAVLRNLGAACKKAPSPTGDWGAGSGGGGGGGGGPSSSNQLAQLLRSQRTLFGTKIPILSAMQDAVTAALLNKCSEMPPNVNREQLLSILSSSKSQSSSASLSSSSSSFSSFPRVFRLKEGPLLTLRRVCRLFLLLGGGPGAMRNEYWLTCLPSRCVPPGASAPPPFLSDNVPLWHRIQFPGLMIAFGDKTAVETYKFRQMFWDTWEGSTAATSADEAANPNGDSEHAKPGSAGSSSLPAPPVTAPSTSTLIFPHGIPEFRAWEMAAELRSLFDCAADIIAQETDARRRKNKRLREERLTDLAPPSDDEDAPSNAKTAANVAGATAASHTYAIDDALNVQEKEGRMAIIGALMYDATPGECSHVVEKLQADIEALSPSSSVAPSQSEQKGAVWEIAGDSDDEVCMLVSAPTPAAAAVKAAKVAEEILVAKSDSERVTLLISLIAMNVLDHVLRNRVTFSYVSFCKQRPWLKHMRREAVLALIIFDAVDLWEKKGQHAVAVRMLNLFLANDIVTDSDVNTPVDSPSVRELVSLTHALASSRSRGKAWERLVVDIATVERSNKKRGVADAKLAVRSSAPLAATVPEMSAVDAIAAICRKGIDAGGTNGAHIPFSFVRQLAKRLKKPLRATLGADNVNAEAVLLGIKLDNDDDVALASASDANVYLDWNPITDTSSANPIASKTGAKSSFVSWNDGDDSLTETSLQSGRVSVEELAMEEYGRGSLPAIGSKRCDNLLGGGWVGWHNEGSHARALFRIIMKDVFNMKPPKGTDIFLTPYQTCPLDLHCASGVTLGSGDGPAATESAASFLNSFRREEFDKLFRSLEIMTDEQLCSFMHDTIIRSGSSRELSQIRTLTMVAVGFGGRGIAAILRTLCYDYRHYSGGLPDLLLVRAVYVPREGDEKQGVELVDFESWIGEEFSSAAIADAKSRKAQRMMFDRDEEFLGFKSDKKRSSGRFGSGGSFNKSSHSLPPFDSGATLKEASSSLVSLPMGPFPPPPPTTAAPVPVVAVALPARHFSLFGGGPSAAADGGAQKKTKLSNGKTACDVPQGFELANVPGREKTVLLYRHSGAAASVSSIVGVHGAAVASPVSTRVLAFDFDDTLVVSNKSNDSVRPRFKHVVSALHRIAASAQASGRSVHFAIITNESLSRFVKPSALQAAIDVKCSKLRAFCSSLSLPVDVLVATAQDKYRKGVGAGCWTLLCSELASRGFEVDAISSLYVGDASGEGRAGSFAATDSDKVFAENAGIRFMSEVRFFGDGGEGAEKEGEKKDEGGVANGTSDAGEKEEREEENGTEEASGAAFKPPVASSSSSSSSSSSYHALPSSLPPVTHPSRLSLSFSGGRTVKVQCLFVEVKSSNDRLDARQEDWLNILEGGGIDARVCKFQKTDAGKDNKIGKKSKKGEQEEEEEGKDEGEGKTKVKRKTAPEKVKRKKKGEADKKEVEEEDEDEDQEDEEEEDEEEAAKRTKQQDVRSGRSSVAGPPPPLPSVPLPSASTSASSAPSSPPPPPPPPPPPLPLLPPGSLVEVSLGGSRLFPAVVVRDDGGERMTIRWETRGDCQDVERESVRKREFMEGRSGRRKGG